MDLKLCEFETLMQVSSPFPTQDVRNCVHDTEDNSAYIFNGASIHANICNL